MCVSKCCVLQIPPGKHDLDHHRSYQSRGSICPRLIWTMKWKYASLPHRGERLSHSLLLSRAVDGPDIQRVSLWPRSQ